MLFQVPQVSEADASVLRAIDQIRGTLRFSLGQKHRWEGTLRQQARARAVRGSNSIEGIRVTEDEAFAIVGGEEEQVSVDQTWLAVKGYSDAMTYLQIVAQRSHEPLDESTLLALQFMVQGYDLTRRPGLYRDHEIFVRDDDAGRTVYAGPDPDQVPELMREFFDDLTELSQRGLHPMVQGAMAHLNLVMIHPFADGNGRMSRILQSLMLYREQVAEAEFVSIEEHLGDSTAAYYDILAQVGGGRWSPERDAGPWIEFVLTAHYRQARTVQRRLWIADRIAELVDQLTAAGGAPERSAPALELAFSGWGLRNATYRAQTGVTANTASRELAALARTGVLQQHGAKRGSWYSPGPQHQEQVEQLRQQAAALFDRSTDPYRLALRGEDIPVSSS